jgi:hypothetical protein
MIYNEVSFVDVNPEDGEYEPLIGYLVLEQSQAAVDILGHRLVRIKHMDLKQVHSLRLTNRLPALQTTLSRAAADKSPPNNPGRALESSQP